MTAMGPSLPCPMRPERMALKGTCLHLQPASHHSPCIRSDASREDAWHDMTNFVTLRSCMWLRRAPQAVFPLAGACGGRTLSKSARSCSWCRCPSHMGRPRSAPTGRLESRCASPQASASRTSDCCWMLWARFNLPIGENIVCWQSCR